MRLALVIAFLWAFAGTATAQETQCRAVESSAERLACYDKASPPVLPKNQSAIQREPKGADKPTRGQDMLAAENARLDAMLKNICRGC